MMGFQGKDTIPCNWDGNKSSFYEYYRAEDSTTHSEQIKRSTEYIRKLNEGPGPSKSSRLS